MKRILICGGAGFIGHHLARTLTTSGYNVVIADIKRLDSKDCYLTDDDYAGYVQGDLTYLSTWELIETRFGPFDEIYQLAADMGGAGYVFTGENDLNIMTNSCQININAIRFASKWKSRIFYSSSACMYPAYNQTDPSNPKCTEASAYPAAPDSEYGWEKLFSERLYLAAYRNVGLDVRIARFHNIFGPEGTWTGGKEKAPAALCRKVIQADKEIEIWGTGIQTRSFLYIDECIYGIIKLMNSNHTEPVNLGSEEIISINDLAKMIIGISGKTITIKNIPGPIGVMGRNSDNTILRSVLGWAPHQPLATGIEKTYNWISKQCK